ncbi:hypothetical protein IV500_18180 [Paeniglutamicibacter antarcticus]|uniref:Uncharacterized protein n=1 Tax=Arthrobacter terrae TaxID=2935737 RepID=A0A931GC16_9MICC|nr:hypothetical protein [Arthrobacter terrae]MBG0741297.1 hypothetical protein [Arthrobacter terrae]
MKESEGAQTPDPTDWQMVLFLAAGGLAVSVTTAGARKGVVWYERNKA